MEPTLPPSLGFLAGASTMGFAVAGLFFLRFWRRTRDGFFLAFAVAFFLLALDQAIGGLAGPRIGQPWAFLPRLFGYGMIIAAIIAKNMRSPR